MSAPGCRRVRLTVYRAIDSGSITAASARDSRSGMRYTLFTLAAT